MADHAFHALKSLVVWAVQMVKTVLNVMNWIISNYHQMANVSARQNTTWTRTHVNLVQSSSHTVQHVLIPAANVLLVNTLNKNSIKIKQLAFVMTTNTSIKTKFVCYVTQIKSVSPVKTIRIAQNAIQKSILIQPQLEVNVNVNLVILSKIMPVWFVTLRGAHNVFHWTIVQNAWQRKSSVLILSTTFVYANHTPTWMTKKHNVLHVDKRCTVAQIVLHCHCVHHAMHRKTWK